MEITKQWLKDKKACLEDIDYFEVKGLEGKTILEIFKQLKKDNKIKYATWVWFHINPAKTSSVKLSIYCAELVLHIFEERYPKDDRPKLAIEAAKAWLVDPNKGFTAVAAVAAANAAINAARAATTDHTNYATHAVPAAAYAAVYAATAPALGNWSAARSVNASYDALSYAETTRKIITKMIELLLKK